MQVNITELYIKHLCKKRSKKFYHNFSLRENRCSISVLRLIHHYSGESEISRDEHIFTGPGVEPDQENLRYPDMNTSSQDQVWNLILM